MSDSDVLIRCENVGKKFCRDLKRSLWYGVKDIAGDLRGRRRPVSSDEQLVPTSLGSGASPVESPTLRVGEFWANQDISFEVKRGECLGLIGRNGAGKTTLLKMLNGLIKPDTGRIEMRGKVGALIALGAGFNPILTGRENLYVNGSVLGFSKSQLSRKLPEIIEFADMSDAIDSPVRTYSSGMTVKLGFAIAAHLSPDILIVDEVLAVGDAAFRRKCYDFFRKLRQGGSSIIIVSHALAQISMICDEAIVLENGGIHFRGNPSSAVNHLLDLMENDSNSDGVLGFRNSSSPISITSVAVDGKHRGSAATTGSAVRFRVGIKCENQFERLTCQASIWHRDETTLLTLLHSSIEHFYFTAKEGESSIEFVVDECPLIPGKYYFKASITEPGIPTPYAEIGYESKPFPFQIERPSVDMLHPSELINSAAVHMKATWNVNGQASAIEPTKP